ncbi:Prosaposin [Cladobotryum mycophilum]|uniref:Prosaposin n=1 Tax=Cladobotryum mycophilum TaxID=491253 RepID=A0ABR0S9K0_9HYPO
MKSTILLTLAAAVLAQSSSLARRDIECVLCKRIVEMVDGDIGANRTEEAIIQSLSTTCTLVPKGDRSKCDTFLEQYANELIHILVEEGDPSLACTLLGVCVP